MASSRFQNRRSGRGVGLVWLVGAAVAALLTAVLPAAGEIYRWIDESGTVHFSQDIGDVPARYREQAREGAEARVRIQTYGSSGARDPSEAPSATYMMQRRPSSPGSIRVPFQRQGTLMRVEVRLNDSVTVPFLVDTGASAISIPYAVAQQLGLRIDENTPRRRAMTANGIVSEPIVNLESVQLGGARVENLEASVSGSMSIGLLGGNFFNNFIYQVDMAAAEIRMSPNDRVVSGLTEQQWRDRFLRLREPLGRLEAVLGEGRLLNPDRVRELEGRRKELGAELHELDSDATRAGVPHAWRR